MSVRRLNESEEKGNLKSMINAVQSRIDYLEDEDTMDENLKEDLTNLVEFDDYTFDPNSSWTDIWEAVIEPIINNHFDNIGPGYTQEEAEDDIDALINIFDNEFGDYPNVRRACQKLFDENDI